MSTAPQPAVSASRGVVYNLAGQLLPALAALVAVPILARGISGEAFGVVAFAWASLGYFSLVDLGMGRALTQAVAAHVHRDVHLVAELAWTCWTVLLTFGATLSGVVALYTLFEPAWLEPLLGSLPAARRAWWLLLAGLPCVVLSSGFRGMLEGLHRFDIVNLVRVPAAIGSYALPAALALRTERVDVLVASIVAVRLATCGVYGAACLRVFPAARQWRLPTRGAWRVFTRVGSWMMLSAVVGSAIGYVDRLVIVALVPLVSVAGYLASQDMIVRLTVIPAAFSTTLLPAFSAAPEARRMAFLFERASQYSWLLLFAAALTLAAYAPELLSVWLGDRYSPDTATAARWMCYGMVINGVALIPYTLLQGRGHARAVAWLQVGQLVPFIAALVWLTGRYGIVGAAAAWAVRAQVDALFMVGWVRRFVAGPPAVSRVMLTMALTISAFAPLVLAQPSLWLRTILLGAYLVVAGVLTYRMLDAHERGRLTAWRHALFGRG